MDQSEQGCLGPYTNIENPALSAEDNHGWWLHNCRVTPQYNPDGSIKRYVLYFINVKKDAVAGTSWLYSDDLSPGSWYGHHAHSAASAGAQNHQLDTQSQPLHARMAGIAFNSVTKVKW